MSDSARPSPKERFNTLGLSQSGLDTLLDSLDRDGAAAGSSGRQYLRQPFRVSSLLLQLVHDGGERILLPVASRNISRTGLALLHNASIQPGTRCVLTLPHRSAGDLVVQGVIARCRGLSGSVYEVGVVFSTPIDLHQVAVPGATGNRRAA
jgi:hypothetical protein